MKVIQHRNQSYGDWRDACFALKNYYDSDETFALFCEWSEVGYQGYNKDACTKLWDSIKNDSEKPITLGTLREWAKEDNPEEYKAWREKYEFTAELKLIHTFRQAEVAEYIAQKYSKNLIYKDEYWYHFNEKTKLWKRANRDALLLSFIHLSIKGIIAKITRSYKGKKKQLKRKRITNIDELDRVDAVLDDCENSLNSIGRVGFMEGIIKYLKGKLEMDVNLIVMDNILSFNNGVYELDTGTFRERVQDDYLTIALKLDYSETRVQETIDWIKNEIFYKTYGKTIAEEILQYLGILHYRINAL